MGDIGKNIRQQRIQKNMTQDDLAARIHATRQTVSNYETGRSRPDLDTLPLLAEALECDAEQLLSGKTRPRPDPQLLRRLIIGLCLLGGVLLAQVLAGLVWTPADIAHYRISVWGSFLRYHLQYARILLFGWCAMQALLALQLLSARPCRWLNGILWGLLSLWPLYWTINLVLSGQDVLWLGVITRLLLQLHLFPGYFPWAALAFALGAAICFTKKK
jgi:transcriptional regulator with XRE-family HTH domain